MSGNAGSYAVTNRYFLTLSFFRCFAVSLLIQNFFLGWVANLLNSLSTTLLSYPEVTRYPLNSLKFSMNLEDFHIDRNNSS